MWRSLVARAAGGREVAGSIPVIPTKVVYKTAQVMCGFLLTARSIVDASAQQLALVRQSDHQ